MIERSQYKGWRSVHPLAEDVVVSAACTPCGAQMPDAQDGERHTHDDVDAWMEDHLRLTGHDLFTETHHEPVRWGPPGPQEEGT
ncbi:hypothetical protein ACH41E_33800 [Streptomyces sp. NPDC020412]|uniref:DUF7848 domain-containing protein n=1 Tax=Streptomyces sp. NPDC020412 TaxID=3365073 RepID=UPI003792E16F